jgi:hypothetical protein
VVLARENSPGADAALAAEAATRAELGSHVGVRRIEGELTLEAGELGPQAKIGAGAAQPLPCAWPEDAADVRDPELLAARRRSAVADRWLWRGLLGAGAILVLAATLQVGAWVLGALGRSREAKIETQVKDVAQIQTAQSLAARIAELSEKRLMPFEMLALINPTRPDTVVFQRLVTRDLVSLEVEAQTSSPEDVGSYALALKALPALAEVQTRDVRARDGVTSFVLAVKFHPEALRGEGEPGAEATAENPGQAPAEALPPPANEAAPGGVEGGAS